MLEFIRAQWEKRGVWAWLLFPLSLLVCLLAGIKRSAYQRGLLSQAQLPVPLIVVGNLSACLLYTSDAADDSSVV